MEIIAIQGNFGNLSGKKFAFEDGMCHSVLPNGWGKSTLCAFLRVMLYGLHTAKRDTATALSDKTQYMPLDGKPMYGRLTVRQGQRDIIITRSTGKGGPMQEFDAFYADTGEKCTFLNAKNCGEQLLGMGEDAFRSSAFIDGTDLQRPSEELQEKMLAMAQAGDTQGRSAAALRTLDRWRLDINSGNGFGELPRIMTRMKQLDAAEEQFRALQNETHKQAAQNAMLERDAAQASETYRKVYQSDAGKGANESERFANLIAESERMIRQLDAETPPEPAIRKASEALYGYQGAVRLEREKREVLPQGANRYEEQMRKLDEEKHAEEVARNRAGRPRIRWWALLMALLFAIASAATILFDIDWGVLTSYASLVLSLLAVISVIIAFAGSVAKQQPPTKAYKDEREKLIRSRAEEQLQQNTAASVLQDALDELIAAAKQIFPQVTTIEEAERAVLQAQENLQSLRREESMLQDLLVRQRKAQQHNPETDTAQVQQARNAMEQAQKRLEIGKQELARQQGHIQALGERAKMGAERAALLRQKTDGERRLAVIHMAADAIQQEHAAISARVSPKIAEKTQTYMSFLTEGKYSEVQLDTALHARCAGDDGVLLDGLRLSTGTRDQLYFALRLAVCTVLSGEHNPVPLILDDPFLTFDDARAARAMALLRQLSEERQIIVLSCRSIGNKA